MKIIGSMRITALNETGQPVGDPITVPSSGEQLVTLEACGPAIVPALGELTLEPMTIDMTIGPPQGRAARRRHERMLRFWLVELPGGRPLHLWRRKIRRERRRHQRATLRNLKGKGRS